MKKIFLQTLDVLLQILVIFPKVEPLRSKVQFRSLFFGFFCALLECFCLILALFSEKVTSFIHRMVETLGSSVFPYLPKALEQLLAESEVLIMYLMLMY